MRSPRISELPNYSYKDYELWEGDWELIYGVPFAMSPAPSIQHQTISNNIAWQLKNLLLECLDCKPLLPVNWRVDEQTVVQPDNLIICDEPESETYLTKAPTLIFEILSKSSAAKDRRIKFRLYEREGVRHYIIVDPKSSVAKIYNLHNGKYIKNKDASYETADFDLGECNITFDFSKIWE